MQTISRLKRLIANIVAMLLHVSCLTRASSLVFQKLIFALKKEPQTEITKSNISGFFVKGDIWKFHIAMHNISLNLITNKVNI